MTTHMRDVEFRATHRVVCEEYFRNDLTLQNDGITTEQVEGISDSVEEIELI